MTRMRCCQVALALIPVLVSLSPVQVRAAETTPPPVSTVEMAPPPAGFDQPVNAAPPAAPAPAPATPASPAPSGGSLVLDAAPLAPAASPAPPPGVVLQQRMSPEPDSFYERWSFWAGVGVVAAVIIAVITVSSDQGQSAPSTDLGDHRAF